MVNRVIRNEIQTINDGNKEKLDDIDKAVEDKVESKRFHSLFEPFKITFLESPNLVLEYLKFLAAEESSHEGLAA